MQAGNPQMEILGLPPSCLATAGCKMPFALGSSLEYIEIKGTSAAVSLGACCTRAGGQEGAAEGDGAGCSTTCLVLALPVGMDPVLLPG